MSSPSEPLVSVDATLSELRSECELCGSWSRFTGETVQRGAQTFAYLRCPRGHGDFTVWSPAWVPLLAAFDAARAASPEYKRAFDVLRGNNAGESAALVARAPTVLPLLSIEEVALGADVAPRWCELLLEYDGWRPLPSRALRVEEALATAVKTQLPACVDAIAARVRPGEVDADAPKRLRRRLQVADAALIERLAGR